MFLFGTLIFFLKRLVDSCQPVAGSPSVTVLSSMILYIAARSVLYGALVSSPATTRMMSVCVGSVSLFHWKTMTLARCTVFPIAADWKVYRKSRLVALSLSPMRVMSVGPCGTSVSEKMVAVFVIDLALSEMTKCFHSTRLLSSCRTTRRTLLPARRKGLASVFPPRNLRTVRLRLIPPRNPNDPPWSALPKTFLLMPPKCDLLNMFTG